MDKENKKGRPQKNPNDKNPFALRLRSLMEISGSSQKAAAEYVGVTRQALNKWVNGDTIPDIYSASKLADMFDVSLDYLIGKSGASSINSDIKAVCDITGLEEDNINLISKICRHKDIYSNEPSKDVYELGDLSEQMNTFVSQINEFFIYRVKRYVVSRFKQYLFKLETIKRYCKDNNIDISDSDIDKFGIDEFRIKFSEYNDSYRLSQLENKIYETYEKYHFIDDDLKEDLEYMEYKLSKELNDMIDRIVDNKFEIDYLFRKRYTEAFRTVLGLEIESDEFDDFYRKYNKELEGDNYDNNPTKE